MSRPSRRTVRLTIEFLLLFFAVPLAMTLPRFQVAIIPSLLVAFSVCLAYLLRRPGFDRAQLWNFAGFRDELRTIVPRFLLAGALITAGVWLWAPASLLDLPRRNPALWALVMLLYPLLSVYPQELVFRSFLFHRYRHLLRSPGARVTASAVAFGFVHILFDSWLAVALTLPGGYLFAATYRRSRSLLAASFEHALYGCLVFTVGLGRHFYNGA